MSLFGGQSFFVNNYVAQEPSQIAFVSAPVGDIEKLKEIAEATSAASLCALGQTAANPMLTTIRYFKDEYEAHIKEKKCPALVCKSLVSYYIDPAKCAACTLCFRNCPVGAVNGERKKIHIIDQVKCTKCGTCYDVCPPAFRAVRKISGDPVPPSLPEEQRWIKKDKKTEGKSGVED